jgi:WD40 repeat protein
VKLWRRDGSLQTTLLGHRDQVKQVVFSPDGHILASASSDRTIKFWSLQGTLLQTLKGHDDQVLSLDYHPDGQTLASASRDRTAILWNLNLEELLEQGCVWSQDYLWTNSTLTPSDRRVCPLNSSVKLD